MYYRSLRLSGAGANLLGAAERAAIPATHGVKAGPVALLGRERSEGRRITTRSLGHLSEGYVGGAQ
jgi:hypothetical protein